MSSLSFPDVDVWLALLMADHMHRRSAKAWWDSDHSDKIAFARLTQISVLRLLTTAGAMNGKPLGMRQAWQAYDRLFEDDRVVFLPESNRIEVEFRKRSAFRTSSPKVWADAYIVAFALDSDATLVSFDRALANRGCDCLILE